MSSPKRKSTRIVAPTMPPPLPAAVRVEVPAPNTVPAFLVALRSARRALKSCAVTPQDQEVLYTLKNAASAVIFTSARESTQQRVWALAKAYTKQYKVKESAA